MCENTVQQLPSQTIKLITSGQVITSVGTTVKELVENSIDAGAKAIQVRLENFGLDLIEVKDDGVGVSYDNIQKMFLPGYTSKIKQFEDLDNLSSYGFRGEALAALCKVATVSITTKTSTDTIAMSHEIDPSGTPLSSKCSYLNHGTVISVTNLFSNLPVRRLFLSSKKKMSEELKKTEQIVQNLSLIHPELSVVLIHNKCPIWRKNVVKGLKQSFMQVAGLKAVSKMEYLNKYFNPVSVELIVPKKNLDNVDSIFTNSPNSVYVYVNKRPVQCKILSQPVQEHIFHHYNNLNITSKYSVCFISVQTPPQTLDINLEPSKTKVLLKNQTQVIKLIDEVLREHYGHENFISKFVQPEEGVDEESEKPAKRPKIDKSIGERRTEEFKEKNKDWELEIINDDCAVNTNLSVADLFKDSSHPCYPQGLCSQINANNSVLSQKEVSDFSVKMHETNHKLLISTNSLNSDTKLIDKNVMEKPILKEWPCRPKVVVMEANKNAEEQGDGIVQKNTIQDGGDAVCNFDLSVEGSSQQHPEVTMVSTSPKKEVEAVYNFDLSVESQKEPKNEEISVISSSQDGGGVVNQFDLSMQSISSQMGKKDMKAFTKFARIMQPKICEEFPKMNFTEVARILSERWKALTPDEVKHYEKVAQIIDINRKSYRETKQSEEPKQPNKTTKNLKHMLENLKKKSKKCRPPRREISMSASIENVRELQKKTETLTEDMQILGRLQPSGNWLYRKQDEIGHVRHQGLKELIVYQKMLHNSSIPMKKLEKGVVLTEETLGGVLFNVLCTFELDDQNLVNSDIITKNGFVICINNELRTATVIEIAETIPHFGVADLREILELYQTHGECGGLAMTRPTSVRNYLTNEAIRTAQESTEPPDREEMEKMMSTYNLCFTHLTPICLHLKQIFPIIFNLQNEIDKIHAIQTNIL